MDSTFKQYFSEVINNTVPQPPSIQIFSIIDLAICTKKCHPPLAWIIFVHFRKTAEVFSLFT